MKCMGDDVEACANRYHKDYFVPLTTYLLLIYNWVCLNFDSLELYSH